MEKQADAIMHPLEQPYHSDFISIYETALDKLKAAYDAVSEPKIEQKIRKQIMLK